MAEKESKELPEVTEQMVASPKTEAGSGPPGQSAAGAGLDFVLDVPLQLRVEIGHAELLVREVLQLAKGSVVELDRMNGEPADVVVNDRMIAKGEVTVVDGRLAVRIVEILGSEPLGGKLG